VNALGIVCPSVSCKASISVFTVNAQLERQIRQHLARYYENWLICDEPACAARTRQMNVYGKRCLITGCRGQMTQEYNDKMLYNQLLYYDMLFDIEKAKKKTSEEDIGIFLLIFELMKEIIRALAEQNREGFDIIRGVVAKYLDKCGRRYVDLGGIFHFMT
jgi:DNA polymerase alpha subunit A